MDIYSFIASKDISDHCRKMDHQFTPIEQAVLINLSEKTIREKHEAFLWLAENTPDCEVPERMNCKYFESLHTLLRNLVRLEEDLEEMYKAPEQGCYYALRIEHEDVHWRDGEDIFASREEAVEEALDVEDMVSFIIAKKLFHDAREIHCSYNRAGEPTSCWLIDKDEHRDKDELDIIVALDGIYIDVPIPFVEGDLITCKGTGSVYVLFGLPSNWQDRIVRGKRMADYHSDSTDIMCNGYCLIKEGLRYDHLSLLDVEYFEGKLEGYDRFLPALRKYLQEEKGDAMGLYTLFSCYDYVRDHEWATRMMKGNSWVEEIGCIEKPGEQEEEAQ